MAVGRRARGPEQVGGWRRPSVFVHVLCWLLVAGPASWERGDGVERGRLGIWDPGRVELLCDRRRRLRHCTRVHA